MKKIGNSYGNKKKTARNRRIVELRKKGLGYKALGKMFDLHFTRVREILQAEQVREQA